VRPDTAQWRTQLDRLHGVALRDCLLEWFDRYQFRGVIASVPVTLTQWLRRAWPLVLRENIPTPLEVLRMQARGMRVVTTLTTYPRLRAPVLNKPDAFSFFRHDLEHGYKFFFSPRLHFGQRGFFIALEAAYDRGVFVPYAGDAEFARQFQYLMSDMNTHPEHSRQYLRAILVEYYLRRESKGPREALSAEAEQALEQVLHAVAPVPTGNGTMKYGVPRRIPAAEGIRDHRLG